MKTQWGNIGKVNNTEDKIVRVEWTMLEDATYIKENILWVTSMLPPLSILQLSDVAPQKTFKWNAGKALVVSSNERWIEFGNAWWGWGCDVDPVTLTYAPLIDVSLWIKVNYILTLSWDCVLNLSDIEPWCVYQFLIIQDATWWHTISFSQQVIYSEWYIQNLSPWNISKLIVDYINWQYFVSIESFGNSSVWRNAWIWWNQSQWVISISADWIRWYSIADKNLWATSVFNTWDTQSETNSWKFFQRWNNYWFPYTGATSTSATQVDASAYWPWNYYSSSTFITWENWDSSNNTNLWWWDTWTTTATQWPCPTWYHIPSTQERAQVMWAWLSLWARSTTNLWMIPLLKIPESGGNLNWSWTAVLWSFCYRTNEATTPDEYWSEYRYITFSQYNINYSSTDDNRWYYIRPFKNSPLIPWSWWTLQWWTQLF